MQNPQRTIFRFGSGTPTASSESSLTALSFPSRAIGLVPAHRRSFCIQSADFVRRTSPLGPSTAAIRALGAGRTRRARLVLASRKRSGERTECEQRNCQEQEHLLHEITSSFESSWLKPRLQHPSSRSLRRRWTVVSRRMRLSSSVRRNVKETLGESRNQPTP